jgi:outer membrane protein TolC
VKIWPFILGIVLLSGCARFQPQPISPAETAARLESRSLTNAVLKTFLEKNLHREFANWPAEEWDFEMLTLAAFYFHPSLDVARAQWHAAQAGVKTAGGLPNPTLTVTPGYDTTFVSGVSPWFPAVNLDIPIETAGKRGKRISAAEHLSESARLNIATTAWQVRSGVRSSLLNYIIAPRRAALLQKQVAAQEQIVKLLGQKAEVGDIAGSELTPSRVALTKARLDLTDAQQRSAEARVNLAEAIGVSVNALVGTWLSFEFQSEPDGVKNLTSEEIQQRALLTRTDILAALAEYAAAESALQLEIAKQYPDVHLNPGYQFDQGEHKWSLGIGVDLPVFNRNQGPIAEAKARREESAARFNALQTKVLAEIERATAVFRVSEKNSAALQSLSADQEKRRNSVEAQFKAGATERLDFLNAELESATSQLVLLDGQTKLQQAIGALEDAVQRPLTGDILSAEKAPERSEIQTKSPTNKENKK